MAIVSAYAPILVAWVWGLWKMTASMPSLSRRPALSPSRGASRGQPALPHVGLSCLLSDSLIAESWRSFCDWAECRFRVFRAIFFQEVEDALHRFHALSPLDLTSRVPSPNIFQNGFRSDNSTLGDAQTSRTTRNLSMRDVAHFHSDLNIPHTPNHTSQCSDPLDTQRLWSS